MKAEFQITYFRWKARQNKKTRLAPIYIRSKQNSNSQISYNTSVKLTPEQWNKDKNRPKSMPAKLTELEIKLQATYKDLMAQGQVPTLADLLKHQDDIKKPTDKNILAWCNDYLISPYSEGQKKSVRTLKYNLAGDKEKKIAGFSPSLTFDKLTKPRIKLFFEFLTKEGVANNSQYKRLRALINVAEHANQALPQLTGYEMQYSTVNAYKERLTWPEVKAIIATEAKNDLEQKAKDVFLLACFSGLRIGDILTLPDGKLHQYHFEKEQEKTGHIVLVTRHRFNDELFKKYIKGVGSVRQNLSHALKPLLERSGLTQMVRKVQLVGHEKKVTKRPKYAEISFHSGRRFYARLLNDLGLGNEIARDELGHSFKSVTELYAGSPEHSFRVARVRKAMDKLEDKMEELALMMVA